MPLLGAALARGQCVRMTVSGRSMWPFIRDGDLVEIAPVPPSLSSGAVVLVHLPDERYPLHRLVAQCDSGWLLRGDNRGTPDGIVRREHLLGVATRVERNGRAVGLPLGRTGRWIGWLSGRGWLVMFTRWFCPERIVGAILRRLKRVPVSGDKDETSSPELSRLGCRRD